MACLPTGAFPGSPCPNPATPGTGGCLPVNGVAQACQFGQCIPTCASDTQCDTATGAANLMNCVTAVGLCMPACATTHDCEVTLGAPGFFCQATYHACLPVGMVPGGPCKPDSTCDTFGGKTMACNPDSGMCVIPCAGADAAARDAYCDDLPGFVCDENTRMCVQSCVHSGDCQSGFFCSNDHSPPLAAESSCLPIGGIPGGPCRSSGQACDTGITRNGESFDLSCNATLNICLVTCSDADHVVDDLHCNAFDTRLRCNETLNQCMVRCDPGSGNETCALLGPGWACFQQDVCLPAGTFPGSPCNATAVPPRNCAPVSGLDQLCIGDSVGVDGKCALACRWDFPSVNAYGNGLCDAASDGLLFCLPNAEATAEGTGHTPAYTGICYQKGKVPLGPCTPAGGCEVVAGYQMTCDHNVCTWECDDPSGDGFCDLVGDALPAGPFGAWNLGCEGTYTRTCRDIDMNGGTAGGCPLANLNAEPLESVGGVWCLPAGTIQGSTCRASTDPRGTCDQAVGGNSTHSLICDPTPGTTCMFVCQPLNVCGDFGVGMACNTATTPDVCN
jgi:hypothetical protein